MSKINQCSKCNRRNNQEAVAAPVTKLVPIRTCNPNILIAQNSIVNAPTVHNAMGFFVADHNFDKMNGKYAMHNILNNKLNFLITDVFLSCLNTCVNIGLIDLRVVDINDFTFNGFVNIHMIEDRLELTVAEICQELFSNLYKYCMFGRRTEDPAEAESIVLKLNQIVGNSSNIITHHLAGYYNEITAFDAMVEHNISMLDTIGDYDNAYKNNILGQVFIGEELLERTDSVIEADVNFNRKDTKNVLMEYTFDPSKIKRYEDDEF